MPYRLPELQSADRSETVHIVEGEEDVDRLRQHGLVATTNPLGARKWRDEHSNFLRGRSAVVMGDNDRDGREHVRQVARSLFGKATSIRVLEFPDLPEGGDISDWLDIGHTVGELKALVGAALAWEPEAEREQASEGMTNLPDTDAGNGELFARLYGDRVRFDHRRQRWLIRGAHHWAPDADGEVHRMVKATARRRGLEALTTIEGLDRRAKAVKFAFVSESRQRLDAMLARAKTEAPIADAGEDWDSDAWLFGVSNGVVDLTTGKLRDGRPEDRITLHSDVAFEPEAQCPRWAQFLDEVFEGDADLIDFIQRAVGYSLTGDTREEVIFLLYGWGQNGKSVFQSMVRSVAGSYAYNAPFSTFELTRQAGIPNDVAALAGRRIVTSSETNEGTRFNEARLKALTGGDPVTPRFLHAEYFSFVPVAKIWLSANHRPIVKDDSIGFWRRVRLIPFTKVFKDDEIDKGLIGLLRAELPGVLAWAVRGTLAWRCHGLAAPEAVLVATESYRVDSDPLAQFLEERCVEGPDHQVKVAGAYREYVEWAAAQGMSERERLTSTKFGTRMGSRFEMARTKAGRIYHGVVLLAENEAEVSG